VLALQGLTPADLARHVSIPIEDARRIVSLAQREGRLPERAPATIRRASLDAVRRSATIPSLERVARRPSAVDPFVKYALSVGEGAVVESVLIPLEKPGRFAACVSSQVGCALACTFCATGRMGLQRNLEAWEIVEQVRILRGDLQPGARIHGVLFQGMGEPLANAERVIQAIRVVGDPSALAIDQRNVTVCTAGIPSGIRLLYREVPAVRLALSIGSLRPTRRASLMPIDRAHSLEEVLAAAGEHARTTRLAPLFAYALLADENDDARDAEDLATLATRFATEHGIRPRISLIPYNRVEGASFERSPAERLEAFRAVLRARGVGSIVRYSGGGDVGAACGQLAGSC
jgi:23S rRNA (adenine2503-C2)-methyltransferase